MNVVVTGGAGFIGSHIVDFHLERGDTVWAFDNYSSGKKESVAPFMENSHFQFFEMDICQKSPELIQAVARADRVYHMAAILGQHVVLRYPIETLKKNIRGCECMLEIMAETKSQARMTIASSSNVYAGESPASEKAYLQIPVNESSQQAYRLSKIVNEITALSYKSEKRVFCAIPRIFNIAGPKQITPQGMIIPTLSEQALKGLPMTVYGTGKQTRSFCHIKDLITALDLLLENENSNGEVVNIGSTEEISILSLAEKIKEMSKSHSPICLIPYHEAYGVDYKDIMNCKPDLNKLQQLTGFKPTITLQEIIKEAITEMKGNYGSAK